MRKTLIMLAAAASALVVASPAAAQYYGGPVYAAPAYGAPYGNGYGNRYDYGNRYAYGNRNGGQQWAQDLQQIRYQAQTLAQQGRLTRAESRDLFRDINSAERAIYSKSQRGLTRYEARQLNEKVARIRYELRRYADYDGRRQYRRY